MKHFLPLLTFLLFISCTPEPSPLCIKTNCADYYSQAAAQVAYNGDPECHGDLDWDNDGIACEEPGNSVSIVSGGNNGSGGSGCPTIAACGCSSHTKAQCEADICCKWTIGSGCGCN